MISLLAIACWAAADVGAAGATQLSWYGDGVHLGGGGSWDTTSLDWSASGSTFTAWSNSSDNGATFDYGSGGEPGNVTVAAAITAGNLTFNDTGFTLSSYGGVYALTLAGSATVYVAAGSQAWIDLPLAGSAGMALSGGGELQLASSNTYSGTTTVSTSFLQLAGSNALPSGNLVINGGVIELAAGNLTLGVGSGTGQLQLTSSGGGFAAVGANYSVNLGGLSTTMTWGSTYFLPSSGTTSATLVLGSPWATCTIDFQNPINLGGAERTVQVNLGSGTVAVDAKLSGALSGSGGLTVTGEGALALTASNTYSGGTTAAGGVLSIQNAAGLGSGGVTLAGGTLQLAAAPSASPAVALTANSAIDVTGITAATLGGLSIGGNTLYVTGKATGANVPYSLTLGSGTLSGSPMFNVADNGSGIGTLTLGALDDGGTPQTLTKAGSGMLTLAATAASLVQGTTVNVSGGTLKSAAAAALGSFARVTVNSGATLTLAASQQISSLAGSGSVALGGNLLTVGNSDNQSCTFSGVISGSGGGLAKQGSSILTLGGSDSFTGGTTVAAGTLRLAASAALPGGTSATVNGTLDLNAFGANLGVLAGSGTVNHSGAGGNTLTVGSGDFSGAIENTAGTLALLKSGSGELVLSGSDGYTGGTTVVAGMLDVTNSKALASGTSLTLGTSAKFAFDSPADLPVADPSRAVSPSAAVPEPGALALLAAAGLLAGCSAWRRRVPGTSPVASSVLLR
jgi:autotransporter-associated beta strand protein